MKRKRHARRSRREREASLRLKGTEIGGVCADVIFCQFLSNFYQIFIKFFKYFCHDTFPETNNTLSNNTYFLVFFEIICDFFGVLVLLGTF